VMAHTGHEGWDESPPARALPVTVAGDLVLVREGGVLVSVGAVCVYPEGFEFFLTIGFDSRDGAAWRTRMPGDQILGFHMRTAAERESATRIVVGFPGGKSADSADSRTGKVVPGEPALRFCGGDSGIRSFFPMQRGGEVLRAESRWWVTPLPPPGLVDFSVFLHGAAEPDGTATMDAAVIIEAARGSQVLWPDAETEP
jgi:hypothetical protein